MKRELLREGCLRGKPKRTWLESLGMYCMSYILQWVISKYSYLWISLYWLIRCEAQHAKDKSDIICSNMSHEYISRLDCRPVTWLLCQQLQKKTKKNKESLEHTWLLITSNDTSVHSLPNTQRSTQPKHWWDPQHAYRRRHPLSTFQRSLDATDLIPNAKHMIGKHLLVSKAIRPDNTTLWLLGELLTCYITMSLASAPSSPSSLKPNPPRCCSRHRSTATYNLLHTQCC